MGVVKLIIFLLVMLIFYEAYKLFSNRRQFKSRKKNKKMISCEFCKTFVPQDQCVKFNNKFFCCKKHINLYKVNDDT